jgi:hypothetical protein
MKERLRTLTIPLFHIPVLLPTSRHEVRINKNGRFVPAIHGGSYDFNSGVPQEWTDYVTQMGTGLEVIPHMLYDTATYTDNTTTSLPFFTTNRATADLSNMQTPGQLQNGQTFLAQAISIYCKTQVTTDDAGAAGAFASIFNDVVLLSNTGIMRMVIGEKRYGPWPLWRLPASTFTKGVLATAGAEAANLVHDYGQLDGPLYSLFPNLLISPLQQFNVTLEWPAGAVNLTGNVVMEVLLDGQLARTIQ